MGNILTPTNINIPCLLVNFPFTVSNDEPNNIWMECESFEGIKYEKRSYDYEAAFSQWMEFYKTLAQEGILIYILPSTLPFQDLPYVANIGCYLPSIKSQNIILLSNFKSKPRRGEELIGEKFFESMNYKVFKSPYTFEGEADLKFLRDHIYVGGYGQRTDLRTYKYLMNTYDVEVIPIKMEDEGLYHFDCSYARLSAEKAMVATKVIRKNDLKNLEKYVEIVDVPEEYMYDAWTNNLIINGKCLYSLPYGSSREDREAFEYFCEQNNLEPVIINLEEFELSGAALSCCVMKLNSAFYEKRTVGV